MAEPAISSQFDIALTGCCPNGNAPEKIAVAVSGGGDSLALALLMQDWIKTQGGEMLALTVDHGLRPESADEAQSVHDLLTARGIHHRILRWAEEKPTSRIQERARVARYKLLADCCHSENIDVLAIAHNREDQIETFWMRLAHGSGLDGLAGMAKHQTRGNLHIIRPLLDFSREDLRAVCRQYGVDWIEDPSNLQKKYLRPRLREFEYLLAAEGLSPERLSLTLQKLEDARQALQFLAKKAFSTCATLHAEGYITLSQTEWDTQPHDIQRRILMLALDKFSQSEYPAEYEALNSLISAMEQPDFSGRTLHGCEIIPHKENNFLLCREEAAMENDVPTQDGVVWDHRFAFSGKTDESYLLGALREDGIAALRQTLSKDHPTLQKLDALPFKVRKTIPVLRYNGNIVFIQHLDYIMPEYAQILSGLVLTPVVG